MLSEMSILVLDATIKYKRVEKDYDDHPAAYRYQNAGRKDSKPRTPNPHMAFFKGAGLMFQDRYTA